MIINEVFNITGDNTIISEFDYLTDLMYKIPKEDIVKHFCTYVGNVDITEVKGMEQSFMYKLRKQLKDLYLRIYMSENYFDLTKNELISNIESLLNKGVNSLEDETFSDILNKLATFTDDDCYDCIIADMKSALRWANKGISKIENAEMAIDLKYIERGKLLDKVDQLKDTIGVYFKQIDRLEIDINSIQYDNGLGCYEFSDNLPF